MLPILHVTGRSHLVCSSAHRDALQSSYTAVLHCRVGDMLDKVTHCLKEELLCRCVLSDWIVLSLLRKFFLQQEQGVPFMSMGLHAPICTCFDFDCELQVCDADRLSSCVSCRRIMWRAG